MLQQLLDIRARIEEELLRVPQYQKLKAIDEAIARFRAVEASAAGQFDGGEERREGIGEGRKRVPRAEVSQRRLEAANACAEILAVGEDGKAKTLRTKALDDHLKRLDLSLLNGDPVSSLYSVLARDKRFISPERGHWRLAVTVTPKGGEPHQGPAAEEVQV